MATSGTATTARTLTLTGSNIGDNSISIAIADPTSAATSVTKSGAGKWVFAGANTYTGDTRSGAGTLGVGNSLALQKSTLDMNSARLGRCHLRERDHRRDIGRAHRFTQSDAREYRQRRRGRQRRK